MRGVFDNLGCPRDYQLRTQLCVLREFGVQRDPHDTELHVMPVGTQGIAVPFEPRSLPVLAGVRRVGGESLRVVGSREKRNLRFRSIELSCRAFDPGVRARNDLQHRRGRVAIDAPIAILLSRIVP